MGNDTCRDVCMELVRSDVAAIASAGFARRIAGKWRQTAATSTGSQLLFDLASVTKPLVAVAFATSELDREAHLATFVEETMGTHAGALPIELLFAHRAGLDAHGQLWTPLLEGRAIDRAEALRAAASMVRADVLGDAPFAPVYSDLGYMLAGEALARARGQGRADAVVHERIVLPLGLEGKLGSARTLERSGVALRDLAAPTEVVPWRDDGGAVRGRVHDENAWALAPDGIQGHAGAFGTIEAVLRFGEAVLDALADRASPLSSQRESLAWLVRERAGGSLRAGFDGKSEGASSIGTILGPRTFGHLGFTGTSLWIDPDADVVVALLTNRVFPTRDNVKIRAARPWAHDELARAALR
ncbi:serine hydrolase domain-containing protein [soil metagenome]